MTKVTLAPSEVMGGQASMGTVTLTSAAPTGGASVTLASDNVVATLPNPTVVIPAGSLSAMFSANTTPVGAQTVANITATLNGMSSAPLTVDPPTPAQVQSVTFPAPGSVQGGQSIVGTVTLTQAPGNPTVIQLASNNTAVAMLVSATVTFAASQTTANFTVTTTAVAKQTVVSISAMLNNTTVGTNNLTVTAPPAPAESFTPVAGLAFGPVTKGTMSGPLTVKLTNTGNAALNFTTTPGVSGPNAADYAITGNTCLPATPVPVNGSCTVTLVFTPSTVTVENATLSFTDNGTPNPQNFPLTGTGMGPLVVLPNSLPFGPVNKGMTSGAMTVTLTNNGNAALNFNAPISITGPNAGDFSPPTANTCLQGTPVATGGGTCTVMLTFTPSTTTAENALLNFSDDFTPSPQSVMLTGTGVAPVVSLPNSLPFGTFNVGTASGPMNVKLTNTGTAALNFSGPITITGPDAADFMPPTANTCLPGTPVVSGGGTCTVTLTFKPTPVARAESASLNFFDNAGTGTQSVMLTGMGAGALAPVVMLPTTVPLGNVALPTSGAQVVTLKNTGTASLTFPGVGAFVISGLNMADFSVTPNGCLPGPVVAGGSCMFTLNFTPSAPAGPESATLAVTDNAADSPQMVSLTGTGTAPVVVLPLNLPFGTVNVSTTSMPMTVTLTNNGTAALNFSQNASVSGANKVDFNITASTCVQATPVAANGGNCMVTLTYTPQSPPIAENASLDFIDNNNGILNSMQSVPLTGSGRHWIGVTWTDTDPTVTGYNVYRGTMTGGPYTKLTASPVATTSYMDSDPLLVVGTTYLYVVTAVNSGGESPFSAESNSVIFP